MIKLSSNNWFFCFILFGLFTLVFLNCASFRELPISTKESSEIIGVFSNDCYSSDSNSNRNLWWFIEPKYKTDEKNLKVKLELNNKSKLKAYLIRENKIVREKVIKGKFKDNKCYYTRRVF